MKILIIGTGGREHAIAWRLAQEGHHVFGAPGNPGVAQVGQLSPTTDYLAAATSLKAELTVVGPEGPLVAGVVDQFRVACRPIFGPIQEHAQGLRAASIFAKEFMQRVGIPTARFMRVETATAATDALKHFDYPVVVKADGLAAGKGELLLPTIKLRLAKRFARLDPGW